jgi:iduronate 2-sulfatase
MLKVHIISILIVSLLIPVISCEANVPEKATKNHKNILFIGVDDLRPALGCYGDLQAISPTIDQLASEGVLFNKAYCQYPVCNPSRRSLLSGLRPERFNYKEHINKVDPDHLSLPGYLKSKGYYTASIGKLYHGKGEDFKSWDYYNTVGPWQNYGDPENYKKEPKPVIEAENLPDSMYTDGKVTITAIQKMRELKDKPFFLGVGYRKPHLPFAAPLKYWNLYDRANLNVVNNTSAPEGSLHFPYHWSELFAYTPNAFVTDDDDLRNVDIDQGNLRELTHGYYACISFIDAQIKMLLDELKILGLEENTIIVLWADHGFHLGEQHIIGKHTCYETSSRVPLIICDPENPIKGIKSNIPVELIDLFPTISELCGLPSPPVYDGKSLVPILNDAKESSKEKAFTAYKPHSEGVRNFVGTSIRSQEYRFTEWRNIETNDVKGTELYRLENTGTETKNLVYDPAYKDIISEYSKILKDSIDAWIEN